eukprot:9221816-Heterocapsa_arctica.AAC.1
MVSRLIDRRWSHDCVVWLGGELLRRCVRRGVKLDRVRSGDDVSCLDGSAGFSGSTPAALFTSGGSEVFASTAYRSA